MAGKVENFAQGRGPVQGAVFDEYARGCSESERRLQLIHDPRTRTVNDPTMELLTTTTTTIEKTKKEMMRCPR